MQMIPVENFDAKYILHLEDDSRTWRPCRVVGVCGTSLVVITVDDDGTRQVFELPEVFDQDAEMPPSRH